MSRIYKFGGIMIYICKDDNNEYKIAGNKQTANKRGWRVICRRQIIEDIGSEPDWEPIKKEAKKATKDEIKARNYKSDFDPRKFDNEFEYFKNYWADKNYLRGGKKVKSWKATARNWFRKGCRKCMTFGLNQNKKQNYNVLQ